MADGDELFEYLEKERMSERSLALVKQLRDTFQRYMNDFGAHSAQEKLDAALRAQPELDPTHAAVLAHTFVVADGILTAVAVHLARETN